jgi:peptidoglycan/LPS O-acetylase OafA/YrhL
MLAAVLAGASQIRTAHPADGTGSSYWIYLVHLPVVVAQQAWFSHWPVGRREPNGTA